MTQAIISLQARLSACRGVLVDSNVLLDVATNDPGWGIGPRAHSPKSLSTRP